MKTEKSKTTALATKGTPETGLVNFKDELKRRAEAAAKQEANAGGGQFFSLKAGQLSFGGQTFPNNRMAVIVVDHISENAYYDQPYNGDNPVTPVCYAFGRDDDEMAPHADAPEPQSAKCSSCPFNQWKSAGAGKKGKKCKNKRRLACISAGELDKDGELTLVDVKQVQDEACVFLGVPPTSINAWALYVKKNNAVLGLPPLGVVTMVTVVPDANTQFRVEFTPMGAVPDALIPAVLARETEVKTMIKAPYQAPSEAAPAKPAAKAVGKKKY